MATLRQIKIRLWNQDPRCYYCGKPTILTHKGGGLPRNAATIEHLVSRLSPYRWVKKDGEEHRKVIACNGCNNDRSNLEILCLSRSEVLKRSQGFTLRPKGKIIEPLNSVKDVIDKLGITDINNNK